MRAAELNRKYQLDTTDGYEAARRVRSTLQTWEKDLPEQNLVLAARGIVREKLAKHREAMAKLEISLGLLEDKKRMKRMPGSEHPWRGGYKHDKVGRPKTK